MSVSLSSTQGDHAKNPYPGRVGRPDYEIKGNLISGIDFQGRINYLIIKDGLDLWSKYPNLDDGSQDFFIQELRACTRFEVVKIKKELDRITGDFYKRGVKTRFLNDIQNSCLNILGKKKI